jgi:hypothetical protein
MASLRGNGSNPATICGCKLETLLTNRAQVQDLKTVMIRSFMRQFDDKAVSKQLELVINLEDIKDENTDAPFLAYIITARKALETECNRDRFNSNNSEDVHRVLNVLNYVLNTAGDAQQGTTSKEMDKDAASQTYYVD